eukprot:CAMPEP_0117455004 /NCGR_PEP_ID=MMETSP0759-20121206/11121_1 /TAXON_ID=63605 /ORGANISM="Percolomonas cosmopolitus, Strain WS" /LENGTH=265 /DNA_ID=CAMNT_0005248265 /DNA_START=337 /DNA_END=1131 /DNA_ORIENTATION=-
MFNATFKSCVQRSLNVTTPLSALDVPYPMCYPAKSQYAARWILDGVLSPLSQDDLTAATQLFLAMTIVCFSIALLRKSHKKLLRRVAQSTWFPSSQTNILERQLKESTQSNIDLNKQNETLQISKVALQIQYQLCHQVSSNVMSENAALRQQQQEVQALKVEMAKLQCDARSANARCSTMQQAHERKVHSYEEQLVQRADQVAALQDDVHTLQEQGREAASIHRKEKQEMTAAHKEQVEQHSLEEMALRDAIVRTKEQELQKTAV